MSQYLVYFFCSDGQKMSKRLKNYPDPVAVVHKYGADALRLYLINSPVVRAESLRFKEGGVKDVVKDVFLPWFNAYRFLMQNVARLKEVHVQMYTIFVPYTHVQCNRQETCVNCDKLLWIVNTLHNYFFLISAKFSSLEIYILIL